LRRGVQPRQERVIGFRPSANDSPIEQGFRGCALGRVEDKVGTGLTQDLRGLVDQAALGGLDADVERIALD
jgi:hypothetical protein